MKQVDSYTIGKIYKHYYIKKPPHTTHWYVYKCEDYVHDSGVVHKNPRGYCYGSVINASNYRATAAFNEINRSFRFTTANDRTDFGIEEKVYELDDVDILAELL